MFERRDAVQDYPGRLAFWMIFATLIAVRIPYFLTHHIQEDAYISFRTAFNLADHGIYAFNLDGHTPGITSVINGLLIVLVRLVFHDWAIPALQCVDTALFVGAAYFVAVSLEPNGRSRLALWAVAALAPTGLLISYYCMETAVLVFGIGLIAYGLRGERVSAWTPAGFFLLPLLRPDAIGFGCIFLAALFLLERKRVWAAGTAMLGGVACMALFNYVVSGDFVPNTARAKAITQHADHSLGAILDRIAYLFTWYGSMLPVDTKFLVPFAPLFTMLSLLGIAAALYVVRRDRRRFILVCALGGGIIAVPVAYAVGGVIYPWYLWPSTWLAQVLLAFVSIHFIGWIRSRRLAAVLAAFGILALIGVDALRWAVSFSVGTQSYYYWADVGRFLAKVGAPGDTLFLEPAGYIPYYSGLKTIDEMGITSDVILDYRVRYPQNWWVRYLEEQHPAFTVQRNGMREYRTFEEYQLTPDEIAWFKSNYELIAEFHYDSDKYFQNAFARKLLSYGTHTDYLVYRYRDAGGRPPS